MAGGHSDGFRIPPASIFQALSTRGTNSLRSCETASTVHCFFSLPAHTAVLLPSTIDCHQSQFSWSLKHLAKFTSAMCISDLLLLLQIDSLLSACKKMGQTTISRSLSRLQGCRYEGMPLTKDTGYICSSPPVKPCQRLVKQQQGRLPGQLHCQGHAALVAVTELLEGRFYGDVVQVNGLQHGGELSGSCLALPWISWPCKCHFLCAKERN